MWSFHLSDERRSRRPAKGLPVRVLPHMSNWTLLLEPCRMSKAIRRGSRNKAVRTYEAKRGSRGTVRQVLVILRGL